MNTIDSPAKDAIESHIKKFLTVSWAVGRVGRVKSLFHFCFFLSLLHVLRLSAGYTACTESGLGALSQQLGGFG